MGRRPGAPCGPSGRARGRDRARCGARPLGGHGQMRRRDCGDAIGEQNRRSVGGRHGGGGDVMTRREKRLEMEPGGRDGLRSEPLKRGRAKVRGRRARGRRGESLASARDRQRLREREAAERQRVERMLAKVPLSPDWDPSNPEIVPHPSSKAFGQPGLRVVDAEPSACPVCGDTRIVADEVIHLGTLRLSECLRCEHRWTERPSRRFAELGWRMAGGGHPPENRTVRSL